MKRHIEGVLWVVSFLSLLVAGMMTTKAYLAIVGCVWIASSAIVIPLHFFNAWRRWLDVPNKQLYALWVGFDTLAAMALIGLFIYAITSH